MDTSPRLSMATSCPCVQVCGTQRLRRRLVRSRRCFCLVPGHGEMQGAQRSSFRTGPPLRRAMSSASVSLSSGLRRGDHRAALQSPHGLERDAAPDLRGRRPRRKRSLSSLLFPLQSASISPAEAVRPSKTVFIGKHHSAHRGSSPPPGAPDDVCTAGSRSVQHWLAQASFVQQLLVHASVVAASMQRGGTVSCPRRRLRRGRTESPCGSPPQREWVFMTPPASLTSFPMMPHQQHASAKPICRGHVQRVANEIRALHHGAPGGPVPCCTQKIHAVIAGGQQHADPPPGPGLALRKLHGSCRCSACTLMGSTMPVVPRMEMSALDAQLRVEGFLRQLRALRRRKQMVTRRPPSQFRASGTRRHRLLAIILRGHAVDGRRAHRAGPARALSHGPRPGRRLSQRPAVPCGSTRAKISSAVASHRYRRRASFAHGAAGGFPRHTAHHRGGSRPQAGRLGVDERDVLRRAPAQQQRVPPPAAASAAQVPVV